MAERWQTVEEALEITPPTDRAQLEVTHAQDTWFGIRVMRARADGTVTRKWYTRYTDGGGRDRKEPLGPARADTYDSARQQALALRADAERRRRAGGGGTPTFIEAYSAYATLRRHRWSEDTKRNYEKALLVLAPILGTRIDRITSEQIAGIYEGITQEVRARAKRRKGKATEHTGDATAANALRLARAVLESARKKGTIRANPCHELTAAGTLDNVTVKRRTSAVHRDQLPMLWRWLSETHGSVRLYVLCALTLAFRRSVLNGLRWEWIDRDTRTLVIPGHVTGNKLKLEFAMPISDWLWETELEPRIDQGPWVIPSPRHKNEPLRSIRGSLGTLSKHLGKTVTTHDLRRSAASLMNSVEPNPIVVKRLLSHSSTATPTEMAAVTAGYVVTPEEDLRRAMNKTTERLLEICDPGELARWRAVQAAREAQGKGALPMPSTNGKPRQGAYNASGEVFPKWEYLD